VSSARDVRFGLLLAAGAAVLYGAAYPATAIALRSYTPLGIAAIACTLALPVVITLSSIGLLPRAQVANLDRPRVVRLVILSGLGGLLFIAATNTAIALSGPTITGFVAPLYAVGAALLAVPILGERLRPAAVVSFGVALVGTALLAGGAPSLDSVAGIATGVLAAILFGLYIVLARRWGSRYRLDGTLVTIANLIGRGPVLLVIEGLRAPGTLLPAAPDPAAVVALLTIAFGSSSTANLLLMASVRRVPAARTSAALLLTPISSALLAAVLLGDTLEPIQLVGAAMVLAGIAVASGAIAVIRGATGAGGGGTSGSATAPLPPDVAPG
jgi:probable blue pigment (indigoidine) exporter